MTDLATLAEVEWRSAGGQMSTAQHSAPSGWRIAAAFVIAPPIAALAMSVHERYAHGLEYLLQYIWRDVLVISLLGAYPAAILFGVPTYLGLRHVLTPRLKYFLISGAAVAALPWLLLVLLGPNPENASQGGIATVIDKTRTWYGWLKSAEFLVSTAVMGAFGGFVFWLVAVAGWGSPDRQQNS